VVVATSGSRRLGRPRAIVALGLPSLVCVGCTASHVASAPRSPANRSASATRSAVGSSWAKLCEARPTRAILAALSRSVPLSLRAEVDPIGLSGNGRTAYVSLWSSQFAGVATLNLTSGKLRPIQAFANPATDQADGASDGRWLVWEETYSLQSLDDFTVYAWDSVTGRLRMLGHSLTAPGGQPWPSPWHAPAVGGHYAAWAQGYGPNGDVEVMLANLATGSVTAIRKGHAQPPFFDGSLVVWPESSRPAVDTTLHAVNVESEKPASLPLVLRGVRGTEFVTTDGIRTAYLNPRLTVLYYSPAQGQQAHEILNLPAGVNFSQIEMARDLIGWTTTEATYLANTRIGVYIQVTPKYGFATSSASVMLISDFGGKRAHPILPMHLISSVGLVWPICHAN